MEQLLRDLAFEAYHRGASGWRGLLRVADELHDQADDRARNIVHARLTAARQQAA